MHDNVPTKGVYNCASIFRCRSIYRVRYCAIKFCFYDFLARCEVWVCCRGVVGLGCRSRAVVHCCTDCQGCGSDSDLRCESNGGMLDEMILRGSERAYL
jgi:hypothetical protein